MNKAQKMFVKARLTFNEKGQSLSESAIFLLLVVVVALVALAALGTQVTDIFDQIKTALGG